MPTRPLALAERCLADRREFILSGASLAALPWLGLIAQGAVRFSRAFANDPVQLGVASGDPAPDGFVIWTRLAPDPLAGGGMAAEAVPVKWEIAEDDAMKNYRNALGQQVMIARVELKPGAEIGFSMDKWSGYEVATRRLMSFLADRKIPNPVVLTGDIHSNWVNDLKVNFDKPEEPTVATEFVGTSITSGGNGARTHKYLDTLLRENQFVRFQNVERGYVRCTVTPNEWRSDYQVVEYVDKPGAPLVTRQSFVVKNGHPGAQTA